MQLHGAVRRVAVGSTTAIGLLLCVLVAAAVAGTTHYCSGNLSAGWSCADGNAHSGGLYVEITTDHTGCAALAYGYGGYNGSPTSDNTQFVACTNGSGTNGGTRIGVVNGHGAVANPNAMTTDSVSDAHITW